MDTFVDSSWYFLRYCDPHNDKEPFNKKVAEKFMPVNQYIGGIEHAVLHLLYARFFTKVLRDMDLISLDEPFTKLLTLGMVTKDGAKMSKSLGNVVDPGDIIERYGPDTARLFILFAALPEKELEWSDQGVEACYRFLGKTNSLLEEVEYAKGTTKHDAYIESKLHTLIKECTDEVEQFKFSIAIQHIMELVNILAKYRERPVSRPLYHEALDTLIRLLAPFAPHLAEELWERRSHTMFVSIAPWPTHDERKIDAKAEAAYELIEHVKMDIRTVLELAKIAEPARITLFMPEQWKYDFVTTMKKLLATTSDPKQIIAAVMASPLKQHGQEVTRLIPTILKDRSKLPATLFRKEEEAGFYEKFADDLAEEFGCTVAVEHAEHAKEPKAKQAMPGKPAILIA